MSRRAFKQDLFYGFATQLASLSTCKRRAVGVVIVPPDFTEVLAIGYNGQPRGLPNSGCTEEIGNCTCVHGELNALLKLRSTRQQLVILTTCCPCARCAAAIVNVPSISTVVYGDEYRDQEGLHVLSNGGLEIIRV